MAAVIGLCQGVFRSFVPMGAHWGTKVGWAGAVVGAQTLLFKRGARIGGRGRAGLLSLRIVSRIRDKSHRRENHRRGPVETINAVTAGAVSVPDSGKLGWANEF